MEKTMIAALSRLATEIQRRMIDRIAALSRLATETPKHGGKKINHLKVIDTA